MGHDSKNLLGEVSGFSGAIISPVNEDEAAVATMVTKHQTDSFDFIFDPQLYFPRRVDRGKLATWDYFPKDFETADLSSYAWWEPVLDSIAKTVVRVGATVVCSPATMANQVYSNDYYEAMRTLADGLTQRCTGPGVVVLETVIARLPELANPARPLEIASVVSNTKAPGIYLILLSDVEPRAELSDVEQLKGAMKLIRVLEDSGLPVLVGCTSSDVVLWKAAGASGCATGKFANLRRFTQGRFDEAEKGGRLVPYWFEEPLLAFIRASDIVRVQKHGLANGTTNPFGAEILEQLATDPAKAWVAIAWRQYMHAFTALEQRLSSGPAVARDLILAAEKNWDTLVKNDVFLEERSNDGSWLRPWLRAVVEFNK
jgi:hypothetical protein